MLNIKAPVRMLALNERAFQMSERSKKRREKRDTGKDYFGAEPNGALKGGQFG